MQRKSCFLTCCDSGSSRAEPSVGHRQPLPGTSFYFQSGCSQMDNGSQTPFKTLAQGIPEPDTGVGPSAVAICEQESNIF